MFCLKIDVVDFFLKNLYSEENLKWKFDLPLHYPSSFCHFQISTDRQSLPMLLFKAIICLLL